MRHGRHTLRVTALLPCAAVALITPLTVAASDPGASSGGATGRIGVTAQAASVEIGSGGPVAMAGSDGIGVRVLMSADGSQVSVTAPVRTGNSPDSAGSSSLTSLTSAPAGSESAPREAVGEDIAGRAGARQAERRGPSGMPGTGEKRKKPARSAAESAVQTQSSGARASAHPETPSSARPARSVSSAGPEPSRTPSDGADRSRDRRPEAVRAAGRPDGDAVSDEGSGSDDVTDRTGSVFGTDDLYEADSPEYPDVRGTGTADPTTGEVFPVLRLGAGLTSIGLGLALIALRLRRG